MMARTLKRSVSCNGLSVIFGAHFRLERIFIDQGAQGFSFVGCGTAFYTLVVLELLCACAVFFVVSWLEPFCANCAGIICQLSCRPFTVEKSARPSLKFFVRIICCFVQAKTDYILCVKNNFNSNRLSAPHNGFQLTYCVRVCHWGKFVPLRGAFCCCSIEASLVRGSLTNSFNYSNKFCCAANERVQPCSSVARKTRPPRHKVYISLFSTCICLGLFPFRTPRSPQFLSQQCIHTERTAAHV